jgi:uncharacterized membrane protein YbaN (DUF454 family)
MFEKIDNIIKSNQKHHPMLQRIIGVGFCGLGVIGLILPFMPGFVFLLPGVALISPKVYNSIKTKIINIKKD